MTNLEKKAFDELRRLLRATYDILYDKLESNDLVEEALKKTEAAREIAADLEESLNARR